MEEKIEEKNELSDILLEQQNSNKITQVKRLIVIIVLLLLLFVLVILIMKFINKPDENTIVTYSPLTQPYEDKDKDDKIAVANISIDSTTTETTANTTDTADEITVTTDIQENTTIVAPPVKITQPAKTQATTQTPKSSQDSNINIAKSGHYIQIGSFLNPPDKSFLNNIIKKGYGYNLHKTTVKSKQVTLVLIGPYKSESLARNELLEIKASITKDAFYKKIP
ncbi:MAG: SPOR domain-containing protein [Campylobacteraceae bacterium]|jgi:DedD protein|nr:SPOR domain-containing protein [Campylobacteraceae bacterium]